MTEVWKKRDLKVVTTLLLVILLQVIISCESWKSKQGRNEIVNKSHRAKYQARSAYCLQMETSSGIDDTAPMRFHRETERCYRVGERGPCGEMMIFTMEDADFGVCDCDQSLRCGRPLIFWPAKNRCYYVNDQGPCREGKWLVFGFDLNPVCRRNPCHEQGAKLPSLGNRYWFSYKGQCLRTYTRGYCGPNEILFNLKKHFRPTCVEEPECVVGSISKVQTLTCLPGQRMDFYGQCQREYHPLKPVTNDTDLAIRVTPRPTNLYCLFCKTSK